ncbi:MAG: outer membrane beta-barrel protein [Bacteroidota bacterium]
MKKIVAIAAFFLGLLSTPHAQDGDLRLGFQVSPMVSIINTDENAINADGANLGLKLGMRAEFYFRENYAFIGGLGFSFNSGGTLRYENTNANTFPWQGSVSELPQNVDPAFPGPKEFKYNLQYVEIPFGLKFKTKEFGYLRYYAEIPVFTLGFRSQARGAVEFTNVNEDKIDIKEDVRSLAFSWGAGGGIEYAVSDGTSIIGGISFQNQFTDLSKNYKPDVDTRTKLNNIILRLGVMF